MSNADQKEVLRRYDAGAKPLQIAEQMALSKSAVYATIRKFRGTLIQTIAIKYKNDPKVVYDRSELRKFRDGLKIGDKFLITKVVEDDRRNHIRIKEEVTIVGIYPFVADCDKGSYTYDDLIKAERVAV